LDTARDYQNFLAVVRRDDDVTLDVTDTAKWTLADEKIAKLEGTKIVPVADGETELICNLSGTTRRIPVKVTRSSEKLPISFEKDIVPIMTRSGCNTGSCHGAARGKDGFMISLFGYDPAGDYKRITREIGMRRINLAVPEESLFLTKSTGKVTIRVNREKNGHVANRLQAALWREAISLVAEGVASVEDVDKAVWAGPGLRWAAMGPTMLFNLGAGPGGLQAFCDHFADTFNGWWDDLGEVRLNDEVAGTLIRGVRSGFFRR